MRTRWRRKRLFWVRVLLLRRGLLRRRERKRAVGCFCFDGIRAVGGRIVGGLVGVSVCCSGCVFCSHSFLFFKIFHASVYITIVAFIYFPSALNGAQQGLQKQLERKKIAGQPVERRVSFNCLEVMIAFLLSFFFGGRVCECRVLWRVSWWHGNLAAGLSAQF